MDVAATACEGRHQKESPAENFMNMILEVENESHLMRLGVMIAAGHALTVNEWNELLTKRWESTSYCQALAVIMSMPLDSFKDIQRPNSVLEKIVAVLLQHEPPNDTIGVCLAMKLIRFATVTNLVEKLWNLGYIQGRYDKKPRAYQLPYLYLSVQAGQKRIIEIVPTGLMRVDCLLFYYSGMNKLLCGQFEEADAALSRAYILSKGAKDTRKAIIRHMSLTAFLCGCPEAVFNARMKKKHRPSSGCEYHIWNCDSAEITLHGVYKVFSREISFQRTRRIIIDISKSMRRATLEQISLMAGVDPANISEFLGEMVASSAISARLEDNVVYFSDPSISKQVDEEIARVSELMQVVGVND